MVYHGKPSMACSLCRIRKIKCDQLRPACSQCVRVSAECYGYRNPTDLIFRDQRPEVERRVYSRATAQLSTADDNGKNQKRPALMHVGTLTTCASRTAHLVRSIPTPQRDLVPCLFFQYFTVEDKASGHSLASCLPQTIQTAENDALSAAVSSVGYALLSSMTNSSDKLIVARQKYGIAVRITSDILQSSVAKETCWIIRVILILALFESITCTDAPCMTARSNHLEGASALLETRGVDISQCILGRKGLKLFLQFRSQMSTNSLLRNLPVPDALFQWSNKVKKFMKPDELLSTELWDIMIRVADIRAATVSKNPIDSDSSVRVLLQLDSDLEEWAFTLPSSWRYEIHTCTPQADLYTLCYYKYAGFSIATVWNQYRIARCLVNDLLLTYLDISPPSSAPHSLPLLGQSRAAKETIRNVCTDICASVPYFFRQMGENDLQKPGVGALEIMWALFICASMRCLPEEQRLWAVKQLDKIGHGMGILQALTLAITARSEIISMR